MAYKDDNVVKHDGDYYCLFNDDFWIWDKDTRTWEALLYLPDKLTIVDDRLAILDDDGHHFCNCLLLVMHNRGCLCGGR